VCRTSPSGFIFSLCVCTLRDYEQLGLPFRLFASEVLFNLGLSRIRLGRMDKGMEYLEKAKSLTMIDDHDIIEDVLLQKGEGFTVYSIVCVVSLLSLSFSLRHPATILHFLCLRC
jgi:hypothetical protein